MTAGADLPGESSDKCISDDPEPDDCVLCFRSLPDLQEEKRSTDKGAQTMGFRGHPPEVTTSTWLPRGHDEDIKLAVSVFRIVSIFMQMYTYCEMEMA